VKVVFMWKDESSRTGQCPSISRVTEGPEGYVIVGKKVDAAVRAQIPEVADDEVVSFVPANVIDRIKEVP
jgi:hypothetical protein